MFGGKIKKFGLFLAHPISIQSGSEWRKFHLALNSIGEDPAYGDSHEQLLVPMSARANSWVVFGSRLPWKSQFSFKNSEKNR